MKRILLLGSLLVIGGTSVAWACSLIGQPEVRGPLGYATDRFASDVSGEVLPANAAATQGAGVPFTVEGIELVRLEPGPVEVWGSRIGRSSDDDPTPPSATELRSATLSASGSGGGCGLGTCGRIVTIEFDLEASDETAPSDRLSYAIWFADDPGRFIGPPDDIVAADPSDGRVWVYGTTADEGATLYAQVRAIDQAGNVGPPSGTLRVDTGQGGCEVGSGPAVSGLAPLLFALVLMRRRRSARG